MIVPSVVPVVSSANVTLRKSGSLSTRMTVKVSPEKDPSPPEFAEQHSASSQFVPEKSPPLSPTPTNSPQVSSSVSQHFNGEYATLFHLIRERDVRMIMIENKLNMLESILKVKDCVMEGMKNEINRLQQYTRRYSVTIAGIPKERGEKVEDLRKTVEDIVMEVNQQSNSTTTIADIDKLHRNGPQKGSEQDVILRFKSHSAKEEFYKGRKSLGSHRRDIKIRPSLSPTQKDLLRDAIEYLENEDHTMLANPPDFVFANVHGQIQVKMTNKSKDGLFFTINNIVHLSEVICKANMVDDEFEVFDSDNYWADGNM